MKTLQIQWLTQNNFGGAMVWTMDLDDFTGSFCNFGRYPLINTLKRGLGTGNPGMYKQHEGHMMVKHPEGCFLH